MGPWSKQVRERQTKLSKGATTLWMHQCPPCAFKVGGWDPWVMRIARNLAIDYFRKTKRMPTITSADGEDIFRTINVQEDNREEKIIRNQRDNAVRELIRLLPSEQREVLILRHYAELSFKEIADLTEVSINTALGRMRYALQNMRKLITEKSLSLQ